ncbi:MAG: hypothetical protein Q4A40_03880 [Bacillota bacterium]|nr:hypothetical protein [Bacillota bacterium]
MNADVDFGHGGLMAGKRCVYGSDSMGYDVSCGSIGHYVSYGGTGK